MLAFDRTEEFKRWLKALDRMPRTKITETILLYEEADSLPKTCSLLKGTGGVYELRFDTGPGYRVYLCRSGKLTYLLLNGGDKDTQIDDKEQARKIKKHYLGSKP